MDYLLLIPFLVVVGLIAVLKIMNDSSTLIYERSVGADPEKMALLNCFPLRVTEIGQEKHGAAFLNTYEVHVTRWAKCNIQSIFFPVPGLRSLMIRPYSSQEFLGSWFQKLSKFNPISSENNHSSREISRLVREGHFVWINNGAAVLITKLPKGTSSLSKIQIDDLISTINKISA